MSGHLDMWTIYDHPRDFPDLFVARRTEIHSGGATVMTADIVCGRTLKEVRREMMARGLVCLARQAEDDSAIVEVWL